MPLSVRICVWVWHCDLHGNRIGQAVLEAAEAAAQDDRKHVGHAKLCKLVPRP